MYTLLQILYPTRRVRRRDRYFVYYSIYAITPGAKSESLSPALQREICKSSRKCITFTTPGHLHEKLFSESLPTGRARRSRRSRRLSVSPELRFAPCFFCRRESAQRSIPRTFRNYRFEHFPEIISRLSRDVDLRISRREESIGTEKKNLL